MNQMDKTEARRSKDDVAATRPKYSILVVEDEELLRNTVTRYFKKQGYRVWSVSNGFEALLLLQYNKPHVVITDIKMPKLGGLTMAEGLRNRAETRDIPVILITAYREESYFKRAQEIGATYLLLKPFTLTELHEKVRSVFEHLKGKKKAARVLPQPDGII